MRTQHDESDPLIRALAAAGGAAHLARRINVADHSPLMWKQRGNVPELRCPDIERAIAGEVTCEELRPDVRWYRVKDRKWPHPKGRPLIDVATE